MNELEVAQAGTARSAPITGDDEEFRALFEASYPRVLRTVALLVGDREVAAEVTQDAFVQLLVHWRRVRGFEQPGLWVRRVAIRRAQRERSRSWRRRRPEQDAAAAPPAYHDEPDPDHEVLAAVDALPPKQRAVVVLFYWEDRPMPEIADLLGCSTSSGWSQLHTARRKLAAQLREGVELDGPRRAAAPRRPPDGRRHGRPHVGPGARRRVRRGHRGRAAGGAGAGRPWWPGWPHRSPWPRSVPR